MNRALGRLAPAAPVIVRLIVGGMMVAHGLDKVLGGPVNFGRFLDEQLGLPSAILLGWLVTLLELVGGAMLVVGLLSRLIALLMTVELGIAIAYVSWFNGLIATEGVGFERDLAYIAGLIVVLLLGPGRPSLDHRFGLEDGVPTLAGRAEGARVTSG